MSTLYVDALRIVGKRRREAVVKLAEAKRGTRQHDYWQGVHDALDNLHHELVAL